jgi:hypothetical protein
MTRRILRGLAAAALLVALSAGAVSAGGWATIQTDSGNPPQPNAGEPFTFGFTVLQHGVTPAGWVETPTFLGINGTTGERIEVKATASGADGHFVATVTLPSAGFWTWQVVLTDLIVETAPQPIAVATADGTLPAMDARAMLAAIEGVRSDIRSEYQAQLFNETDAMQTKISGLETQMRVLESQRDSLKKQVDALAAGSSVAAAPPVATSDTVPLFAVIGIAVLAGAISGFAMTMLGRNSRPNSATPDGAIEELAPAGRALTTR